MDDSNGIVIGVTNAAKYLQISRSAVYRMMKNHEFPDPAEKISNGKMVRMWRKSDLDLLRGKIRKQGRPFNIEGKIDVVQDMRDRISALEKQNRKLQLALDSLQEEVLSIRDETEIAFVDRKELRKCLEDNYWYMHSLQSFHHPILLEKLFFAVKKELAKITVKQFRDTVAELSKEGIVELCVAEDRGNKLFWIGDSGFLRWL